MILMETAFGFWSSLFCFIVFGIFPCLIGFVVLCRWVWEIITGE